MSLSLQRQRCPQLTLLSEKEIMPGDVEPVPVGDDPTASPQTEEKKGKFLRGKSKKISKKVSPTAVQATTPELEKSKSTKRGKDDQSQKIAKTKTCPKTLKKKEEVLVKYPFLALEHHGEDHGRNIVLSGANSMRAEVLDMVTMATIMSENMQLLTHAAVDRFFEWLPLFGVYMERYFFVEEDVLMKWIVAKGGPLKGNLRASVRMMLRGKLQKMYQDIADLQSAFVRQLPAGERVGRLMTAVDEFALQTIEYFRFSLDECPQLINKHYNKAACKKLHLKWVEHVVSHVGTEDFLVLYTRWMKAKDVRDWKTKVLLRTDFKFMAYNSWEKDMDYAHFQIAGEFAEALEDETNADDGTSHAEFMRHKSAVRQHREGLDGSEDDDGDYSDEEEFLGEYADEEEPAENAAAAS